MRLEFDLTNTALRQVVRENSALSKGFPCVHDGHNFPSARNTRQAFEEPLMFFYRRLDDVLMPFEGVENIGTLHRLEDHNIDSACGSSIDYHTSRYRFQRRIVR
jgi:hypothetical protein